MPAAPAIRASIRAEHTGPTAACNCCDFDQPAAAVAAAGGSSVGSRDAYLQAMDARLLLVLTPILLAAGWAAFNIGRAAVGQLQLMLKRANG